MTGTQILERLRKAGLTIDPRKYVSLVSKEKDGTPFAFLVAIILSQNTNDAASIKAYNRLRKTLGAITVEKILSTPPHVIEDAIRPAGLANQKTSRIIMAAQKIASLGGDKYLLEAPPQELRETLLSIPGIGRKTVDVFLSQLRGQQVFAVDTHAMRIARRWCLTKTKSYQEASRALAKLFQGEDLVYAHKMIIALGRQWCKARKPECGKCPLKDKCPYAVQHS